jgi:heavy metal translocating P-type ATPase
MSEPTLRRVLAIVVLAALSFGLLISAGHAPDSYGINASLVWTAGTVPVIAVLVLSILRELLIGRVGVDAIALISMTSALLLGEPLAAVVVALMCSGGTLLEDFARGRAQRDLRALRDRSPRIAHRRRDGHLESVAVLEVDKGDELVVRAGELVPVDGELLDPTAKLDESALTGEPLAVTRYDGQKLHSGTVNAGQPFMMRATAVAEQSTYAGIVRLVEAAQTARAPFSRMADRYALLLLPIALLVAGAAWWWSDDPLRGLAVLVVATPCPLILAAMKGSQTIEALAKVKTVIFDKTGTLTTGGAELLQAEFATGRDEDEVWTLAASLEQASHHVVASAITELARARNNALYPPEDVREKRGAGLSGVIMNRRVRVGSRDYILSGKTWPSWCAAGEARYRGEPVLRAYVEVDDRVVAVFTLGDAVRADAAGTISHLRDLGVSRMVLLTGDVEDVALRLSVVLPFDRVVARASPETKVEVVREELAHQRTMMIGDGINDAPALAAATVGVAMGARGATASSEAADMVVLPDRLHPIASAVETAQWTVRIALQSVIAGLALSGIGMAAAAVGYLTPVQGALVQEGIDLAVILNALRALHAPGATSSRADGFRPGLERTVRLRP